MPTVKLPPRPDRPPRKKKYPAPKGYIGGWAKKPDLKPKKFKTVKTGKGYYIAKPLGKKPKPGIVRGGTPTPKAPKAPAPPPGPWDAYKTTFPAGYEMGLDLDRREAAHTGYVTGQVMPWLSSGLRALTGVDPAQPGYNPQIQQQYLANVQGQVGGALSAAAAAVPGAVAPTTPGASTAAPNAYLGAAMREASAQGAGSAILSAQAHAAINTAAPNIYAQSALRSIADYAAGLPAPYVTKRNELRMKIENFIEDQRHAKVMESIGAMTAQGNLAISMGNLGIRGAESAADISAQEAKLAQDAADAKAKGQKPPPATGYIVVPDGSGGWEYKRDPSYVAPGSSTDGSTPAAPSPAKGQYPPNKLRKEGYVGGWKVKPKNVKGPFVEATDGTFWIKKPGAGSTPKAPKSSSDLQKDLRGLYKPGGSGGWEERYPENPRGAAVQVAEWVRENKPAFAASGRLVLDKKLAQVLQGVIGGGGPGTVLAFVMDILTRGYMTKRGGKWYWK